MNSCIVFGMRPAAAVAVLAALAHVGRLELFRLLVRRLPGRVTPAELIAALELGPSQVSAHLRSLERVGLLSCVRRGRSLRYRAEIGELDSLARFLVEDCCRGRSPIARTGDERCRARPPPGRSGGARAPLNVLFVDRRNASRSLIAEAVLRARSAPRCRAFSAGTAPAGAPDRRALNALRAAGYDVSALHPRRIAKRSSGEVPRMDVVVTLCAEAANSVGTLWRDAPVSSHREDAPVRSHWEAPAPCAHHAAGPALADALVDDLERRVDTFLAALDDASCRQALQAAADRAGGENLATEHRA